jgi:hypothetical protein
VSRRTTKVLLIVVSLCFVGWILRGLVVPVNLFMSAKGIDAELRRRTPVGTPRAEVQRFARDAGWRSEFVNMRGYETAGYPAAVRASSAVVANAGSYYAPLRVDVRIVYAFDSQDRLIAVETQKEVDAP